MEAVLIHLKNIGLTLLAKYGYWGILGLSLSVAIYQPIAPDIFILGQGGLGFNCYLSALIAIGGTFLGVTVGYWLGKHLGLFFLTRVFRIREKYLAKGERLFARYGQWGVLAATLSPIPLREVSWLAGIFGMPFCPYLLAMFAGLTIRYFGLAFLGSTFGSYFEEHLFR